MFKRIQDRRRASLLGVIVLAAVIAGCDKSPENQHQGNPFDPSGPNGGDALQLETVPGVNQILLTWQQPKDLGIDEYFVYLSADRTGPFEQIATVPASNGDTGTYTYSYPAPTQTHWFKIQAFTEDGGFSLTSLAVAAGATVGPTVVVGDTVSSVATRYPELTIAATMGDSLLISLNEDLSDAVRVAQTGNGEPTVVQLDLGPATADSTFAIRVLAYDDTVASEQTVLNLPVDFEPVFSLVDANASRLATRVNDIAVPESGVVRMRFAASEAQLASAEWVPGAAVYPDYELGDSANSQDIWGEFEGDFGFNVVSKLVARPDLLGSASFQLSLPSNRVITGSSVQAQLSAAATEMRFSESPDFVSVPWRAYADTAQVELSAGQGTKTIFCQYRNDWTQSTILSDYCVLVSQGIDVRLFAPVTGNVVVGGSSMIVQGTSSPGTVADAIDSVKVDLGDGLGFREVIGTETWQLGWSVPRFEADTELVLRARAWADTFVITDVATVTVSQLAIAIIDPLPEATVIGGEPLVISGTAVPVLGGDPLGFVTVNISTEPLLTEQILAEGTDSWSATWETPTVSEATPVEITAIVTAGGETASQTISVTLTP